MKTLADIDGLLSEWERRFALPGRNVEQLSEPWFQLRLGLITASNASRAVSKKGTQTRNTFLCELIAAVCTGVVEELNFKQTDWGKQHEIAARSSYEFANDIKIIRTPFVFKDNTFRIGCSPDGFTTPTKGTEIKCPWDSTNYIKFLLGDEVKTEWAWQNEFSMWVTGAEEWDLTFFDPRMKTRPMHTITVWRDPERQAKLNDAIPELIHDMDLLLAEIGVKFGDQWKRIAAKNKDRV